MAKIAVVLLAPMEPHHNLGRVTNALGTVKEAKEAGDDVQLIFDGAGVEAAVALADPEHKMHRRYRVIEDKVAGVCRYCARAFDVYEEAEELGIPFLAEFEQHPSLRGRIAEGYQIVTF